MARPSLWRALLRWRGLLLRLRRGCDGCRFRRRRCLDHRPWLRAGLAVQPAVVLGGAENSLHVVLRLGERDVVDELVFLEARPLRLPSHDAALARVVAREGVVRAAELFDEPGK